MRSPEALKPRETHRTPNWPGAELSMETIRAYLADLSGRGRRKGTVQMYSAKLRALYDYLPPDKQISRGTLAAWRAFLLEAGYSPSTVNTHLSAANGLMEYMGRRDLQLVGQLEADKGLQPELSRVEYLRLLQAARILEKERTYLLVKIFALAGIRVVQSFANEDVERKKFRRSNENFLQSKDNNYHCMGSFMGGNLFSRE